MNFHPNRERVRWAAIGALFGVCFPSLAMGIRVAQVGRTAALAAFLSDPLLWIITTAPLFLGMFAYIGGTRQDEVRALSHGLEAKVAERTASLKALLARLELITDGTGDGVVTIECGGRVEHASRVAKDWLGEPADQPSWHWLFGHEDDAAGLFRLGLHDLEAQWMPFEVVVDQMPKCVIRDGHTYHLNYRRLEGPTGKPQLLLVLRDMTAEVIAERAAREGRELQAVFAQILRDDRAWERFGGESQALIKVASDADDETERKRALHTLKGNAAVFGLARFAEVCHTIESELEENGPTAAARLVDRLQCAWHECEETVAHLVPKAATNEVRISRRELDELLAEVERGAARGELAEHIREMQLPSIAPMLERLAGEAQRLANALGRRLAVQIEHHDVRIEDEALAQLGPALVHAVRNAVDHGIEAPAVRRQRGKPETATIRLHARRHGPRLSVIVEDDGGGVDWAALSHRAEQQGLEVPAELEELLFVDGLSSRDEVTGTSGRGVGLAALRAVCRQLGGDTRLESTAGRGSVLTAEICVQYATERFEESTPSSSAA